MDEGKWGYIQHLPRNNWRTLGKKDLFPLITQYEVSNAMATVYVIISQNYVTVAVPVISSCNLLDVMVYSIYTNSLHFLLIKLHIYSLHSS